MYKLTSSFFAMLTLAVLSVGDHPSFLAYSAENTTQLFLGHSKTEAGFSRYTPQHITFPFAVSAPDEWNIYEDILPTTPALHITPDPLEDHRSRYEEGISLYRLIRDESLGADKDQLFREIDLKIQGLSKNGFLPIDAGILEDMPSISGYWLEYKKNKHRFIGAYVFKGPHALWLTLKSNQKNFDSNKIIYQNILASLE